MKKLLSLIIVGLLGFILIVVICDMPRLGSPDTPGYNQVAKHYLDSSVEEVRALNSVTAILVDYRGYDTLIETIVLFTASISVMALVNRKNKSEDRED